MSEQRGLSAQVKKRLTIFFVTVVLLSTVAGFLWPSSSAELPPASLDPVSDEQNQQSESEVKTETTVIDDSDTEPTIVDENDLLLTETYGLVLPINIRAREIILETDTLLADFKKANEEIKEFADSTRYSCQQFETAIDPSGSGPGGERLAILARITNSNIGLEIRPNTDNLVGDEISIVGRLDDLSMAEVLVIEGLVQKLNDINSDRQLEQSRFEVCTTGIVAPDPAKIESSQSISQREADVVNIVVAINNYIANSVEDYVLPSHRDDIKPLIADSLSHYSLDQINATGSWDGANLPVDGDFSWNEGYNYPPSLQSGLALGDAIIIIVGAGCDDKEELTVRDDDLSIAIIHWLPQSPQPVCVEV